MLDVAETFTASTQVTQISLANATVLGCPAICCLNCLPKVSVALSKVLSNDHFITNRPVLQYILYEPQYM